MQHCGASVRSLQEVCPTLPHVGPGLEVQSMVIRGTHSITWCMG
jgi:hypothetical protein